MATRIQTTFPTLKGETFTVYIDDSGYGGAATTVDSGSDGFTLRYDGERDQMPGIIGSSFSISVVVDDANRTALEAFALALITNPENHFSIKILYNTGGADNLYWIGYILPDLSGFEDKGTYFFNIKGNDGLGRLKGVDYSNAGDPYGLQTFLQHILNCLGQTGLDDLYYTGSDIFLRTVVNWVDSTIGAPAAAKCPLAYSRVDGAIFAARQTAQSAEAYKFDSCYDVLQAICRHWKARLMYSYGCYRFEQIAERSFDTFYMRSFSKTGSLLSSASGASADNVIPQIAGDYREAGGIYNYLPALSRVEVDYDHKTSKNLLEDLGYKWWFNVSSGSGALTPYEMTGASYTTDTFLRVSGYLSTEMFDTFTSDRFRYVFACEITLNPGGDKLKSLSTTIVIGGYPVTINQPKPVWDNVAGTRRFEIWTPWIFPNTGAQKHLIQFNFDTPNFPSGQTSFTIDFKAVEARDKNDSPVSITQLTGWHFFGLTGLLLNTADAANYEKNRLYVATNDNAGNSSTIEIESIFGHPVKGWTAGKIQTSSDAATWTDTTATWGRNAAGSFEFGQLLAKQILAAQQYPVKTYNGALWADLLFAHQRIILDDNSTWLLINGEFSARTSELRGEWYAAGLNETNITVDTPVPYPGPSGPEGDTGTGLVVAPRGAVNSTTGIPIEDGPGILALSFQATNITSAAISVGSVTSIPVVHSLKAKAYKQFDIILVVDYQTLKTYKFVVSADAAAGATSISVNSVSIDEIIPKGSFVFWSTLNAMTTLGGDTIFLPEGTAQGQILRWNNSTLEWVPYSGTTAGYVLTWDATNGWQEQAGGGYTDEQAQDAVGTILVDSATIDFTYSDPTPSITAIVIDNSIIFAKMQDIATQRLIGRNTAGTSDPEQVTIAQVLDWISATQGSILYRSVSAWSALGPGSAGQLLQTGGAAANPSWFTPSYVSGAGSGAAGHVAIWQGSSALTIEGASPYAFFWDTTNHRLGINTTTPSARCTVNTQTVTGSDEGLRVTGAVSANLNNVLFNTNSASATANLLLTLATGGVSAGDPAMQLQVSGGSTWSVGVDNSDSDKIKIKNAATPSDTPANSGITMLTGTTALIGINNDAPAVALDATLNTSAVGLPVGTTAQRPAVNHAIRGNSTVAGLEYRYGGRWYRLISQAAPSIAAGAAAGTGPSVSVTGNDLCGQASVTTGTSPGTGSLFTVTFNQALDPASLTVVVFSAQNSNAATNIAKFYVSATGNTSWTISVNAALTASTQYVLFYQVQQ